ncbi:MAG: hypothetical protein R2839_08015 [Thermomicrobiales bacterium]
MNQQTSSPPTAGAIIQLRPAEATRAGQHAHCALCRNPCAARLRLLRQAASPPTMVGPGASQVRPPQIAQI